MNPRWTARTLSANSGFNPHPARGPGESQRTGSGAQYPARVSIRTRPEGRVNLGRLVAGPGGLLRVSIRTRPEGRVNPISYLMIWISALFQSAPGPRAG